MLNIREKQAGQPSQGGIKHLGSVWMEQEELPGILQGFCRGEHSEGQGIEVHTAGWRRYIMVLGSGACPKGLCAV